MKKKTTYTYIANDGKKFNNYKACKQYEEEQSKLKQYHVDATFAAYRYVRVMAKSVEEAKEKAIKHFREISRDFVISEEPIAIDVKEKE